MKTAHEHVANLRAFAREVSIACRWLREREAQNLTSQEAALGVTESIAHYMRRDHDVQVEVMVLRELAGLLCAIHQKHAT